MVPCRPRVAAASVGTPRAAAVNLRPDPAGQVGLADPAAAFRRPFNPALAAAPVVRANLFRRTDRVVVVPEDPATAEDQGTVGCPPAARPRMVKTLRVKRRHLCRPART